MPSGCHYLAARLMVVPLFSYMPFRSLCLATRLWACHFLTTRLSIAFV